MNDNEDRAELPFHGEIPGVSTGATFETRVALKEAGVHGVAQQGIWTNQRRSEAAASIVLSGGYPDDQDLGDTIFYTGMGGQENKRQVRDQSFENAANRALLRNRATTVPVRVIRGKGGDPAHSPSSGYRYDGLYHVIDAWQGPGRTADTSVFQMCMFQLQRATDEVPDLPPDQKRWSSAAARLAVERRAMVVTMGFLREVGYHVRDVGVPGNPYDIVAIDDVEQLRVEVKGRLARAETVDLTHREVDAAHGYDRSALAVVDGITVTQGEDGLVGEGGRLRVWLSWSPAESRLDPIQYRYELPGGPDFETGDSY